MMLIIVAGVAAAVVLLGLLGAVVTRMPPSKGSVRRGSFGAAEGMAGGSDVSAGLSHGGGDCHSGDTGGGDCGGGDGGGH